MTLAQLAVLAVAVPHASAAVSVTSATYHDLDADGYPERVRINWGSGQLLVSSIRPHDFTIRVGSTEIRPTTFYVPLGDSLTPTAVSEGTTQSFVLVFPETVNFNTGSSAQFDYSGALLEYTAPATAGGKATFTAVAAISKRAITDCAPPVSWGAVARQGGREVIMSFSEKVRLPTGDLSANHFDFTAIAGTDQPLTKNAIGAAKRDSARYLISTNLPQDRNNGFTQTEVNDNEGDGGYLIRLTTPLIDMAPSGTVACNQMRASDPLLAGSGRLVTTPRITAALMRDASSTVMLEFNTAIFGSTSGAEVKSTPSPFALQGTTAGIVGIRSVAASGNEAGSNRLQLTLSEDPSLGASLSVFPDATLYAPAATQAGDTPRVTAQTAQLTLDTADVPPALTAVTLDLNQDGYLDAIQVTGSQVLPTTGWSVVRPAIVGRVLTGQGREIMELRDNPGGDANQKDLMPCTSEPELGSPACTIQPQAVLTSGTCQGSPLPPAGAATVYLCLPSTAETRMGTGLLTVSQSAYRPTSLPAVTLAEGAIAVRNIVALDGADPVLLAAYTQDRSSLTSPGAGRIDAYILQFSEPIRDSTFSANDFQVAGYTITSANTDIRNAAAPAGDQGVYDIHGRLVSDRVTGGANDEFYRLNLAERPEPDTDATPELTTRATCETPGCATRDLASRALAPVGPGRDVEKDRARPVLVRVNGGVGLTMAELVYSERVESDPACPPGNLSPAHFTYRNNNAGGASGIGSTPPTQDATGRRIAITLNAPVSNGDFSSDMVGGALVAKNDPPQESCLREPENNDSPARRIGLRAIYNLKTMQVPPDDEAPSAPTIALDAETEENKNVGVNYARLQWQPVGDDADTGRVARYEVRVAPTNALPSDWYAHVNPDGVRVSFDPATPAEAGPNANPQRALVTGLASGTAYAIRVFAVDDGQPGNGVPNRSPLSNEVRITTEKDEVKPGAVGNPQARDLKSNGFRLEWVAPADDGTLAESGPVRGYAFAIHATELTEATCDQDDINSGVGYTATKEPNDNVFAEPGRTQSYLVRGLVPSSQYWVGVMAFDEGANYGLCKVVGPIRTLEPDEKSPGKPEGLTVSGTGTEAVITFRAPADNKDEPNSGRVERYQFYIAPGTTAPTPFTPGLPPNVKVGDATPVAPGQTQNIRVTGLTAGAEYVVAVVARDAADNEGE
ncbi:MAG TPA: fibronectin type III domain-containing protein, partial [Candidatus Thermoplasmatota archaeon]|nr:fibronectin type III domain-containing protein [Candidatus Thermoplasmatota archaeon]